MIRSMTGFGRAETQLGAHRVLVEIKSVNHRFLNTKMRMPREYARFENELASRCSDRCSRGHLSVRIEVAENGSAQAGPVLNSAVTDRLIDLAEELAQRAGIVNDLSVSGVLSTPGAIEWEGVAEPMPDAEFRSAAMEALESALDGLVESRRVEGDAIERDLRARLATIEEWRRTLAGQAPQREEQERERLREKLVALLPEASDEVEARVAQEIVLLADRLDISEELARLGSHVEGFLAELDGAASGGVGRKLTFVIQEMNREANTIAAKANNATMQQAAIEIKAELEKLREQVENVE